MGDFVNHNPDGLSSKEVIEIIDSVRNSQGYQLMHGKLPIKTSQDNQTEKNVENQEINNEGEER